MNNIELTAAVRERQIAAAERDKYEKIVQVATDKIKDELIVRGGDRVEVGEFNVTLTPSDRVSYDPKKLLEAGVTMQQLEKAKVVTASVSLRVTRRAEV